jgi:ketosteroid isomerase-like protein
MTRRRQRALLVFMATMLLPLLVLAQEQTSDDDLLRVRESVWRAWFAGDGKLLQRLVPAETIVISAGDKEWKGQSEVLKESADFHASGAKLTRLEFPKTRIQHFGNVAIVWSEYVLEIDSNGKKTVSGGRATEIFVWRGGAWLNPGWHTDAEK